MGFFSGSVLKGSKKEVVGVVPACRNCGLYRKCKTPKMGVSGKGRSGLLIVLPPVSGPEDDEGRVLVGKAGQYTKGLLKRAISQDLDEVSFFVPSVACHHTRKPLPSDVYDCRPLVNRAIEEHNPAVVVPIGYEAISSVISIFHKKGYKPESFVGYQIPCRKRNMWIVPLTNPAKFQSAKDSEMQEKFFMESAAPIKALLGERPYGDGPAGPDPADRITRVHSPAKAAAMIRRGLALTKTAIAFDYEANMLKPDSPKARLYSCAICFDGKKTIAYPMVGEAVEATKEMLVSPVPKIAANMKYEDRWSRAVLGVQPVNWHFDTMLAAHCLDNRPGVTGLKFQAFASLGVGSYDDHIHPFFEAENPDGTNNIHEIAMEDLLLYNGLDALLEYELGMKQMTAMGYDLPRVSL